MWLLYIQTVRTLARANSQELWFVIFIIGRHARFYYSHQPSATHSYRSSTMPLQISVQNTVIRNLYYICRFVYEMHINTAPQAENIEWKLPTNFPTQAHRAETYIQNETTEHTHSFCLAPHMLTCSRLSLYTKTHISAHTHEHQQQAYTQY